MTWLSSSTAKHYQQFLFLKKPAERWITSTFWQWFTLITSLCKTYSWSAVHDQTLSFHCSQVKTYVVARSFFLRCQEQRVTYVSWARTFQQGQGNPLERNRFPGWMGANWNRDARADTRCRKAQRRTAGVTWSLKQQADSESSRWFWPDKHLIALDAAQRTKVSQKFICTRAHNDANKAHNDANTIVVTFEASLLPGKCETGGL